MTLTEALARSTNTIAVALSFKYERENLLATMKKFGIEGIHKSCSMALGDQGITPLDQTSAYATLASGGKHIKGYAIAEIHNLRDELIYSRERDEPEPPQIFKRESVEMLNEMLSHVVTEGTGRAATLEFTHSVGKTGTSSDYRDGWFLGFTGQYVTGVWYGNDNFTSTNRVTGGSLPASTWHNYMVAAHVSYNIPPIPGMELHPRQVEEAARIAEIKQADPTLGTVAQGNTRQMSEKTRKVLTTLGKMFKEAPTLDAPGAKGASLNGSVAPSRLASGTQDPQ